LATLWPRAPDGPAWAHEVKFDGYRMQARLDHGRVTLRTRKALDWTEKFGAVAKAVAKLDATAALIDGEIVVEDENGISDFSALHAALKAGRGDRLGWYTGRLIVVARPVLTRQPVFELRRA